MTWGKSMPLAVDLDGTLIATDLLVEGASHHVMRNLGALDLALWWLRKGRAGLKHQLADATRVDVATLPYRADVLEWLEAEGATGRAIVLATAANERLAGEVSAHLGLFSEVLASSDSVNLSREAKAKMLTERFGHRGFEYVGNSRSDVPVWAAAAVAHVVGGARLRQKAAAVSTLGRTFDATEGQVSALLQALRPHQWLKNALVAVPLFASQRYTHLPALVTSVIAASCFCLAASSVYLVNDLVDVGDDRHHPQKRSRPFASGRLSLATGWVTWPVLLIAAVACAASLVSWAFAAILVGYVTLSSVYSFWAKRRVVIDVVGLAGLYTIRLLGGAVALRVTLTMWLLGFSLLVFLSLALVKRVSELSRLRATGGEMRGRGYLTQDLEVLSSYGVASSIGAVIVFALFIDDPTTAARYHRPEFLWAAAPVLLTWLMRVWLLAHRGSLNEDPVEWALSDRKSLLAIAVICAVFVMAKVVGS